MDTKFKIFFLISNNQPVFSFETEVNRFLRKKNIKVISSSICEIQQGDFKELSSAGRGLALFLFYSED